MAAIIKVNPDTLKSTASEFASQGASLQQTTTAMIDLINGVTSAWAGEAAQSYINKFNQLQDDMDRMFRMVQEYSNDLQEIATAYQAGEQNSMEAAEALSTDVII